MYKVLQTATSRDSFHAVLVVHIFRRNGESHEDGLESRHGYVYLHPKDVETKKGVKVFADR